MLLVAGLGNPGPKYAGNRHNVGFMVVERLAERWDYVTFREKFKGRFAKASFGGEDVGLLEPLTYMNLSGESVQKALAFFKIGLDDLLVVHDELDLPYGEVRIKVGGGTAGHNGLRSIVRQCGGNDFTRVRVGIGRPRSGAVEGHVLSDFSSDERATLTDVVDRAADMVEAIVDKGPRAAMNALHGK